jgi:hypothetical protein
MIPVLFFSGFSLLGGAPKTSTETVPMCWKENRGSLFKSPHIPALRYSRVKIGEFHGSKKVYGYPHLPQR